MKTALEELLGLEPSNPLDQLAQHLVAEDNQLLDALVAMRRQQNLTQDEVARRMGISQGAVARIESGDRDPHLSTLRRYAHAVRALVTHSVTGMPGRTVNVPEWEEAKSWTSTPIMVSPRP